MSQAAALVAPRILRAMDRSTRSTSSVEPNSRPPSTSVRRSRLRPSRRPQQVGVLHGAGDELPHAGGELDALLPVARTGAEEIDETDRRVLDHERDAELAAQALREQHVALLRRELRRLHIGDHESAAPAIALRTRGVAGEVEDTALVRLQEAVGTRAHHAAIAVAVDLVDVAVRRLDGLKKARGDGAQKLLLVVGLREKLREVEELRSTRVRSSSAANSNAFSSAPATM